MKFFIRNSIFSFKALFNWIDPKNYLLMKVLTPLFHFTFFMLILKYVNPDKDLTNYIIGNSFLLTTYNAVYSLGRVISEERGFGTLKLLTISPSNKFTLYLGRGSLHILDAVFGVTMGLVFSYFLFDFSIGIEKILGFYFILLVSIFSVVGFGLIIGVLGLLITDMSLILNTAAIILITFTGANFPISELPLKMQFITRVLPLTHGIKAAQLYLKNDISTNILAKLISIEFFIGGIYFIIGYFFLSYIEQISKKEATLEIY